MPGMRKMGMVKRIMGPMADPRSRFFMTLASDQRIKILELLKEKELSSAQLIDALELDASVVSRHLMMLRNIGLVSARKEGVALYFSIANDSVFDIVNLATKIIKEWYDKHLGLI